MSSNLTQAQRMALQEVIVRARQVHHICSGLHDAQRAFVCDSARKSAALCGRRSGKSHGLAGKYLIVAARNPNEVSVFIGISAARANEILGRGLRVLTKSLNLEHYGLAPRPYQKGGQFMYEFPNGHRIWVAGCKNRAEAEKFRGDPYCLACIDECDSMRGHLQYTVEEVLEPATLDFKGQIALTGTPGVTPEGFFHDVTTGSNGRVKWSTHTWTVMQNPFIEHAATWEEHCRDFGLQLNSPSFCREWLGQWVLDLDALCYKFDFGINSYVANLDHGYRVVIGVDLGVNDATAMVVTAYYPGIPDIWTLESHSWTNLSPSAAYVRLQELRLRFPGARVVADTGGIGKGFTKEWQDTHNLYVEPAQKLDVAAQIAFMNGLLASGSLRVHHYACRGLIRQIVTVPWNEQRTGHEESYEDHELDAWRYAVLAIRTGYSAQREEPAPGTPEAAAKEQASWKAKMLEKHTRKGI